MWRQRAIEVTARTRVVRWKVPVGSLTGATVHVRTRVVCPSVFCMRRERNCENLNLPGAMQNGRTWRRRSGRRT